MNLHDKIRGCLLGGAIGDCLGGPYEGCATASESGNFLTTHKGEPYSR
jgi:ADP-ribosylglycohydrolase